MNLTINSQKKRQVIDITDKVNHQLQGSGIIHLLLKHTTAALTIADLDPGTDQDYLKALDQLTPAATWNHPHQPSHFPDHLWPTLIGFQISLPYRQSSLLLGSWQRLIILEFDGPRQREIELTTMSS